MLGAPLELDVVVVVTTVARSPVIFETDVLNKLLRLTTVAATVSTIPCVASRYSATAALVGN